MIRINQLKIAAGKEKQKELLLRKAAQLLRIKEEEILDVQIVRQSIDARKKPDIFYSYTIDVTLKRENKLLKQIKNPQISFVEPVQYQFPVKCSGKETSRPVIVGTGPAGLFCGYYLAMAGFEPILLERGQDVDRRMKDVEAFWQNGKLHPDSNVQFGEGGAGTFSDGKLNTLVKEKEGRNRAVLETFVRFGAPPEILYDAKPHIGTDILCRVVKNMRLEIERLGGSVLFNQKLTGLRIGKDGKSGSRKRCISGIEINHQEECACNALVLAIGHSARDTFEMLEKLKIPMEAKSFAVGLRVEHPQAMINQSQYGREEAGILGAAAYKVAAKASDGRGVYSFCMCPGGYVVNASSEEGRLAVNGMSYSGRNGENANSAIIVSVTPQDFGSDHPLAGIAFQRQLEERAYQAGKGKIPIQRYGEFKRNVEKREKDILNQSDSAEMEHIPAEHIPATELTDEVHPQNKGGCQYADVSKILPQACNRAFVEGMSTFADMIQGFDRPDAIVSGVESRTSSPVRILRSEDLMSEVSGLYPCGEGAGYAGGITSAAMDGIRVAEAVAKALLREASE